MAASHFGLVHTRLPLINGLITGAGAEPSGLTVQPPLTHSRLTHPSPLVHSLTHSLTHASFTHSPTPHSLTPHSRLTHPSFNHSLTHSPPHSLTHSLTHSPTPHSLTHAPLIPHASLTPHSPLIQSHAGWSSCGSEARHGVLVPNTGSGSSSNSSIVSSSSSSSSGSSGRGGRSRTHLCHGGNRNSSLTQQPLT